MAIETKDLDAIGEACKEIIVEELEPIKERLDALEAGTAGKSDADLETLEAQVTQMKSALDQTMGARKSLDDDDSDPVAEKTPHRDSWGRRIKA